MVHQDFFVPQLLTLPTHLLCMIQDKQDFVWLLLRVHGEKDIERSLDLVITGSKPRDALQAITEPAVRCERSIIFLT